MIRISIFCSL